jgi:hypothetical protein
MTRAAGPLNAIAINKRNHLARGIAVGCSIGDDRE